MENKELSQLITDLSDKYGYDKKMKQKLCLILNELFTRYRELDERYPRKNPVGRPKKGE